MIQNNDFKINIYIQILENSKLIENPMRDCEILFPLVDLIEIHDTICNKYFTSIWMNYIILIISIIKEYYYLLIFIETNNTYIILLQTYQTKLLIIISLGCEKLNVRTMDGEAAGLNTCENGKTILEYFLLSPLFSRLITPARFLAGRR